MGHIKYMESILSLKVWNKFNTRAISFVQVSCAKQMDPQGPQPSSDKPFVLYRYFQCLPIENIMPNYHLCSQHNKLIKKSALVIG